MPELPEVETVRRGLQPVLEGALIVRVEARRPDLRFPLPPRFSQRLTGRRVADIARRAKFLLLYLDGPGPVLICHLGMSGSFRIEVEHAVSAPGAFHHPRSKDAGHDHIVFHVVSADGQPRRIVFNDPRRFGFMLFAENDAVDDHPMLAGLGLEPTGNALDGAVIADMLRGRKAPLKAALLDQRRIAGLGNIYVCEALWRARLRRGVPRAPLPAPRGGRPARRRGSPTPSARPLPTLSQRAAPRCAITSAPMARSAISSTLRRLRPGRRALPARGCAGIIRRIVQCGRSTFYCPTCQR